MKRDTLITLGIAAVALYLVYRLIEKFKEKAQDIADAIAAPIANAYVGVTLPGGVSINATIRLPDGRIIPADQVHVTKATNSDRMEFDYMGARYELLARTPAGPYQSRRLS